jgi:XTP/dITP diphosphohydrolase
MEFIFSSNNTHKIEEIRKMIPSSFTIRSLKEASINASIEEKGHSFSENAFIKANYIRLITGKNCFADDSGLCVNALEGNPGIYSARYAGIGSSDKENCEKLLADLQNERDRSAYFITVICLLLGSEKHFFEGRIDGAIAHSPKGNHGFGYDSIFIPQGSTKSFAELLPEEKNKLSHRSIAINKMVSFITSINI